MSGDLWCVVGLGNPGPQYAGNRHNLGQMVLDELARRIGATFSTHRTRNLVGEARLGVLPGGAPGPRVVLATFPHELHGLGLLMAEALLAVEGCAVVSLGDAPELVDVAHDLEPGRRGGD